MSLINNMLNDLEKRRSADKGSDSLPDGLKPTKERSVKGGKSKKLYWLLGVLVVLIIAIAVWFYLKPKASSATAISKPKVLAAGVQKKVVAQPKQATLKSVLVTQKGDQTELNILVPTKMHYQMQMSKNHQKINLTVDEAGFSGTLPNYAGSAIQKLSLTKGKNTVTFSIALKQGATVLQLHQLAKPSPRIQLVLKKAKTPKAPPVAAKPLPLVSNLVKKKVLVKTPMAKAQEQYQAILKMISNGQTMKAMTQLTVLLKTMPSFMPARQTLAILLVNNQQPKTALGLIDAGLKLNPASPELVVTKAQILLQEGKLKAAKTVLQKISPPIKQYPDYYQLAAAISQRLGEYDYAGQYYQQLLRLTPSNGKYWLGLGVALESTGKPNAAARAYRMAIETKSLNPNMQVFTESRLNELGG